MNRTEDAQARQLAQSVFDRPLVLEAGAGTGKTTALVARVVCWILGAGWDASADRMREESGQAPRDEELAARVLEGVVAITFTEAAAAEMETRVGEVLAQIAATRIPAYLLRDALPPDDAVGTQRAEWLLASLDRLQIRTIHSWCHRILSRFPLEAGLHPEFQVDADGQHRRDAANEVVEEHLRRAYRDHVEPALLLLAADGKGPNDLADALSQLSAQGLRARELSESPFCVERLDQFVAEFLILLDEPDAALLGSLRAMKRSKNTLAVGEWIPDFAGELRTTPPQRAEDLQRMLQTLPETSTKQVLSKLEQWGRGTFGKTEEEALSPDEVVFLKSYAPRLLSRVRGLLALEPEKLEAARSVLLPLLEELETRLHSAGVVSYEDLLRRTRDLLDADNGVRQMLRDEIDQLMVDEFQDTNALQCEIVAYLALQGPIEKRPGLFLVGDPKQSIYGWRGADLSSYHRFVEEIEKEHGPRHYLNVNFRSVPAILREVERAVAPVMHERAGYQPGFQELLASETNQDRRGYEKGEHSSVEHWVSGMKSQEAMNPGGSAGATQIEAQRLVSDLLQLQSQDDATFSWSDVGLLYRSGGDLEVYLRELRRAGIPYAVENDRQYFRRREIMDAVALLNCVLDPANQLAMVAFLRSPWVGVPDAAWLGLWRHGFPEAFARLYAPQPEALAQLDRCIRSTRDELPSSTPQLERIAGWDDNLRGAVHQVAALRESFQQDAPELFVRKLRNTTLVEAREAARFLGPYRAANLERFFRLLRDALCELKEDPSSLLRQLRRGVLEESEAQEGRLQASARDAVRVMTIHKAKGLDFGHVYLLQTHKQGRRPGRSQGTELASVGRRWEYLLLGYPSLGWQGSIERSEEVNRYERVRLLYVALTRAKNRMVTLGMRSEGSRDPQRAHALAELLGPRSVDAGLEQGAQDCLASQRTRFVENTGPESVDAVLWRLLPAEEDQNKAPARSTGVASLLSLPEVLAQEDRLAADRRGAEARMARPFRRGASAGGHDALAQAQFGEAVAELLPGTPQIRTPQLDPGASIAMAVGTAVHALLEHYDPCLPTTEAWDSALSYVDTELQNALKEPELPAARERAEQVLAELQGGSLLQRLRELQPYILGREVPVLLAPDARDADAPVGYHPGSIDMLYRDPEGSEIVVVDFKTDQVGSPDALAARVESYREQGSIYRRAVAQALGLSKLPRFELWFLRADHIEVCR